MLNEMRDKVIKKFGFEAIETVDFCITCEDYEDGIISLKQVKKEFKDLMK